MPKPITDTLANHILKVYETMEGDSTEVDDLRIYKGSLSRLVRQLGISSTYYSVIWHALYDNGYCAQGEKGGRDKPSTVILLRRPEIDELMALTKDEGYAMVSLVNRMDTLEANTGGMYIVGALQELEKRLVAVEEELRSHRGKSKK